MAHHQHISGEEGKEVVLNNAISLILKEKFDCEEIWLDLGGV
jgi:hypothetical protein